MAPMAAWLGFRQLIDNRVDVCLLSVELDAECVGMKKIE